MQNLPERTVFSDGSKMWKKEFDKFRVKVYVPTTELMSDIINYGFLAPYQLVFEETECSMEEAKKYADETGLAQIASDFAGSVVFVYPTNEGGWEKAPADIFEAIISQSKISQYYEDGAAKMWDRFNKCWGEYFIRGAILRTCLYGKGITADYIAKNCLKKVEGDGLFGKGDITPVTCVLENLSVLPDLQRKDIPVISVGNSEEVNAIFKEGCDHLLIKDKAEYVEDYYAFTKNFKRMVGNLEIEPDFEGMGVAMEPGVCTVQTARDNKGDDAGTTEHKVGYMAYYNKASMDGSKKLPLVLCFHGGGDSTFFMSSVSGWSSIAAKYDFLLVLIENHLNSTATEMMELIVHLEEKYHIDSEKIYSTGFSMGGCKSWDMYQEYPQVFAAVAPMDATFDVGCNSYGSEVPGFNQDKIVPVFYTGGEITPLPELPFQAQKCTDRMGYVMKINQTKTKYDVDYEKQEEWKNKIWGIDGDVVCKIDDPVRGSVLTLNLFESEGDKCYCVFGSISGQGHEVRHHTCEHAWLFMNRFRRLADGTLVGGDFEEVVKMYQALEK